MDPYVEVCFAGHKVSSFLVLTVSRLRVASHFGERKMSDQNTCTHARLTRHDTWRAPGISINFVASHVSHILL